jgi:enoyl-[acyl-carrier protein] reductase I
MKHFDMNGKRALVVGVANERSLAFGAARSLREAGAELAITYLNERMERKVRPLAESLGAKIIAPLDMGEPGQVEGLFREIRERWGSFDVLVHSIAFAEREDLTGRFLDTSKEGFLKAVEISAYSLVELCRQAEPLLNEGSSVVTMTYHGSQKAIKNYNVMGVAKAALEASVRYLSLDLGEKGVRINAISAGAIKTLSAAGVRDFRTFLHSTEEKAPLKENIDIDDIGNLAHFLCAPASKHITGSIYYVDSGMHILGT